MNKKVFDSDEIVIKEYYIKLGTNECDGSIIITNKNIIIKKMSGIFVKKLRVFDTIKIENIKVYNDTVQVKVHNDTVEVISLERDLKFKCKNFIEANTIKETLTKLRTGDSLIKRSTRKLKKAKKIAKEIVDLGSASLSVFLVIKHFFSKDK